MTYDDLLHKIHGKRFDIKLFIIFFFNGIPNAFITCILVMMLYAPPYYHCQLPDYALNAIEKVSVCICTVIIDCCMVLPLIIKLHDWYLSKFELNSKKSNSRNVKKFSRVFISFFFPLKARLQALKFEFCQIKLG